MEVGLELGSAGLQKPHPQPPRSTAGASRGATTPRPAAGRLPGLSASPHTAPPSSGARRLPAPTPAHPQLFRALLGPADAVPPAAAAQPRAGGAHEPSLGTAEPVESLAVFGAERPWLGPRLRPGPCPAPSADMAERRAPTAPPVAGDGWAGLPWLRPRGSAERPARRARPGGAASSHPAPVAGWAPAPHPAPTRARSRPL